MTWSFLLTWLTAKVCFKEVTRADDEEVVRDEPVRETEPRDLSGDATAPLPATNAAVDEAPAAIADAERRAREEKARADAEAAERARRVLAVAAVDEAMARVVMVAA
jgi:hypothetical protein